MFRTDMDGLLNWITEDNYNKKKPILTMDYSGAYLKVGYVDVDGQWIKSNNYMNPVEAMEQFTYLLKLNISGVIYD